MTKIKKHLSCAGQQFPARALWRSRNVLMGLAAMVLMAACHKGGIQPEAEQTPKADPKTEQLSRYLSVILGVDQNKIIYDQSKEEFQIANSGFRMKRDIAESYYGEANEYKSNYEAQK